MAVTRDKSPDPYVKQILAWLEDYERRHPDASGEAYRHNSASVRIRIIDPGFSNVDRVAREDSIWGELESLPEDVRADITMLVLVAPNEVDDSLASREFQDPVPSRL